MLLLSSSNQRDVLMSRKIRFVFAWVQMICMDQYQCKDHDTVSLVNFALSMEKSAFARGMHDRLRSMRVSSCR
jgi:hypothetical protein